MSNMLGECIPILIVTNPKIECDYILRSRVLRDFKFGGPVLVCANGFDGYKNLE